MTLTVLARSLDAFPHLTTTQRADIFHAFDLAPDADPLPEDRFSEESDELYDAYLKTPAGRAWLRVREIPLAPPGYAPVPHVVTLDEASGWTAAPTKLDLLKTLARGERLTV